MNVTDILETVVIETKNGPCEINKSDFDKEKHKIHKAKAEKPTKKLAK